MIQVEALKKEAKASDSHYTVVFKCSMINSILHVTDFQNPHGKWMKIYHYLHRKSPKTFNFFFGRHFKNAVVKNMCETIQRYYNQHKIDIPKIPVAQPKKKMN